MKIISSTQQLHGVFLDRLIPLIMDLCSASPMMGVYETIRTPFRQAALYAQGRTSSGKKVTKAAPFESAHQYGLAADIVLWKSGKPSWEDDPAWDVLGRLSRLHGLEQLSFERPHVQLPGWRSIASDRSRWTKWTTSQWDQWSKEGR